MASARPKVSPELQKRLTSELGPGERLLYAAQPDWRAEWGALFAILIFGVFWSGISLMFFGMSLGGLLGLVPFNSDGKPAGFGLNAFFFVFSLPFVAIGVAMLAAPFLGIRKSKNTVHAVTDARLLNVYGGRDAGAESHPLAKINFIKRKDRRDGSGSLHIGYGVEKDSDGDPRPLTLDWSGIPDAKRAEAVIREQAKWVR
jgi:hypothetical protein